MIRTRFPGILLGRAAPPSIGRVNALDTFSSRLVTRSLSLFGLSMLAACSPLRVAEFLVPSGHLAVVSDLPYGDEARQRLDVYRPRRSAQPAPTIVFLYGGRWQEGSKREYRLLGNTLTRRGFVAVVPEYRLYPEVRFPAWVEDGAHAIRWTIDNIHRFGGDARQIYVIGHSAGAHTATLLALDEAYLETVGVPADAIRGFVSLAGPVDTVWTDPDVQALMGPPESWTTTYPVSHIRGTAPPLLLLHGARDGTVSAENSIRLAEHISAAGGQARSVIYPGVGHIGIVVALIAPWLRIAPVLSDVESFAREQSRAGTGVRGEPSPDP
jgi:acetyl esterase/lipase